MLYNPNQHTKTWKSLLVTSWFDMVHWLPMCTVDVTVRFGRNPCGRFGAWLSPDRAHGSGPLKSRFVHKIVSRRHHST